MRRRICLILALLLMVLFLTSCTSGSTATDTEYHEVKQSAATEARYCGSVNSDVFHYTSCRYVDQILDENYVTYFSREDAVDRGKRPCKVCKP